MGIHWIESTPVLCQSLVPVWCVFLVTVTWDGSKPFFFTSRLVSIKTWLLINKTGCLSALSQHWHQGSNVKLEILTAVSLLWTVVWMLTVIMLLQHLSTTWKHWEGGEVKSLLFPLEDKRICELINHNLWLVRCTLEVPLMLSLSVCSLCWLNAAVLLC